jgi:PadR family transcriptional regulator, regulatory protein AphA
MSSPKLTPFSYVVLTLVGDGGAGAHDIVRMMRRGRVYWTAPESQFYAEPKRLAQLGLLHAQTTPGKTRERTHYTLTAAGRAALREWLATPAHFARIQNEAIVRVLASEYADRGEVLAGLGALRTEIAELTAGLDRVREIPPELRHRERALRLNQRLARRILEAHVEWLEEVEREL